jgi:hypothetical protein
MRFLKYRFLAWKVSGDFWANNTLFFEMGRMFRLERALTRRIYD